MKLTKITSNKIKLVSFFLTMVVLLLPVLLRWLSGNTTLGGDYSYHHWQLANNPTLLFQSKFFTPYGLILLIFNSIVQSQTWSIILPVLLGLGTIFLFGNLLKRFDLSKEDKFFILVLLIISPAFIYFFTFSNQYALIVFLLLLTVNFLNNKKLKNLVWIIIPIMLFFDLLTSLIFLGLLFIHWLLRKDKTLLYFLLAFLISSFLLQMFYPQPWFYEPLKNIHFFAEFFSDLGGLRGISFFYLLLSSIGLIITWKKRKIYRFSYLAILFFLIFFNFNSNQIIYLNFVLIFYAGLGLRWVWEKKWQLNFLKNLLAFILVVGIVFSFVSHLNQINQTPPNNFIKESLEWLKDNSKSEQVVIAHQSKGFWIESIAERPVFLDVYDEHYNSKLKIAESIFYSRDLKLTIQLLEENEIKYIWIDSEMLRGQVWSDEDEGLLFLFRNPRFRNVYVKRGIEIWRFD